MSKIISGLKGAKIHVEKLESIVKKYSFISQTNRAPGQEDIKSFIRKRNLVIGRKNSLPMQLKYSIIIMVNK